MSIKHPKAPSRVSISSSTTIINKTHQVVLVLAIAKAAAALAASEATQQGNQENFSTWRLFPSPPQALALLFW